MFLPPLYVCVTFPLPPRRTGTAKERETFPGRRRVRRRGRHNRSRDATPRSRRRGPPPPPPTPLSTAHFPYCYTNSNTAPTQGNPPLRENCKPRLIVESPSSVSPIPLPSNQIPWRRQREMNGMRCSKSVLHSFETTSTSQPSRMPILPCSNKDVKSRWQYKPTGEGILDRSTSPAVSRETKGCHSFHDIKTIARELVQKPTPSAAVQITPPITHRDPGAGDAES